MPDIVIGGATFPGVPAVDLPKSGGGTARFHDMSGDMAWLGAGLECINDNIYSLEDTLNNTPFNGWTPSTTSKVLVANANCSPFTADMDNYTYYDVWECGINIAYDASAEKKSMYNMHYWFMVHQLFRRPNTLQQFKDADFGTNIAFKLFTNPYTAYYDSNGAESYAITPISFGLYFGEYLPSIRNTTSANPTITPKHPSLNARCNSTYFSTASAALVDQPNSHFFMRGKLYRVPRENGIEDSAWREFVRIIHE